MKTIYTLTRIADGQIDYCFDTLADAVSFAKEYGKDQNVYEINKIKDDNGTCAEVIRIFDLDGYVKE